MPNENLFSGLKTGYILPSDNYELVVNSDCASSDCLDSPFVDGIGAASVMIVTEPPLIAASTSQMLRRPRVLPKTGVCE